MSLFAVALVGAVFTSTEARGGGYKPKPFKPVADLLRARCVSCHNQGRHPEGVDLSSYDAIMHGGRKGPIVIPGKPDQSVIVHYIDGSKNPRMPMNQKSLSGREIERIREWIRTGAGK
jgi:hypothetical protein